MNEARFRMLVEGDRITEASRPGLSVLNVTASLHLRNGCEAISAVDSSTGTGDEIPLQLCSMYSIVK